MSFGHLVYPRKKDGSLVKVRNKRPNNGDQRYCKRCDKLLSQYNKSKLCHACGKALLFPDELNNAVVLTYLKMKKA